ELLRWDAGTGKRLAAVRGWGPPDRVDLWGCVPSADGEALLLNGWDRGTRRLLVRARSGRTLAELPPMPGPPPAPALSADGRAGAVPGDRRESPGVVRLVEVASGRERARLEGAPGFVGALAFSPDGRLLACGGRPDSAVRLWRLDTRQEVRCFRGHELPVSSL